MARTQAEDYDEKRQAIADKAAELFALEGVAGASLARIAKECGMSKSLIYHYYASKEDLLLDVMLTHMEELVEVTEEVDGLGLEGPEAFHAFSRALMAHYMGAAHSQKVLLYELNSLPDANRKKIVGLQRQLVSYAQDLLADAVPGAPSEGEDMRARTMLFFGMLNWSHSWFSESGPLSRDELADIAAKATLGGF